MGEVTMLQTILDRRKKADDVQVVLYGSLLVVLFMFILGGFLWPYTIHTIGAMLGRDVSISFWVGGLLTLLPWFDRLMVPAAVITWIVSLFIGA